MKPFLKSIVLCFLLLFISLSGQSQRSLLGGIGYAIPPKDFTILNTPSQLPDISKYNTSWEEIVNGGLNSFTLEHWNYNEVSPGYSIFSLGNYSPFGESFPDEIIKNVAYKIFQNPILQEAIYTWIRPYYADAFDEMAYPDQQQYIDLLTNAELYLEKFDYKSEVKFLKMDEKAFTKKRGKLNAFLFRRIHSGQMSLEECKSWIKRILSDFRPHLKDPNREESYCEDLTLIPGANYLCHFAIENKWHRKKLKCRLLDPNMHAYDLIDFDALYIVNNERNFIIKSAGKEALISLTGQMLTPMKYEIIFSFNSYGLACVCGEETKDTFYVFEERTLLTSSEPPYDDRVYEKGDTIFYAIKTRGCGFINDSGKELIPIIFDIRLDTVALIRDYPPYSEYREIFVDYDEVDFLYGIEILRSGNVYGVMDTAGNILLPFEFSYIQLYAPFIERKPLLLVNKGGVRVWNEDLNKWQTSGGKWAVYDVHAHPLSDFDFELLEIDIEQDRVLFQQGGEKGYLDEIETFKQ